MFETFTTHMSVNGEDWILHFSFDTNQLRYSIEVLNKEEVAPCTMAMISHYYWKIIEGSSLELKAAEHGLNDLIRRNNDHLHMQLAV